MQKWKNEIKTATFTMTEHMFTFDTSNITNILPTQNLTSTTSLAISDPIFDFTKDLKLNMKLRKITPKKQIMKLKKPMVPLIEIDIKFTHSLPNCHGWQIGWHWLAGNSGFPSGRIFIFCFSEPLGINIEILNALLLL